MPGSPLTRRRRGRVPRVVPRVLGVVTTAVLVAGGIAGTAMASAPAPINLDSASCPANIVEGDTGGCITELQDLLNIHNADIGVDGQFGPQTYAAVRQFQSETGIGVDGQVGPQTKAALYGSSGRVPTPISLYSSSCPSNIVEGDTGGCITELQNLLDENGQHIEVDGQFGPNTFSAVESFQTAKGLGVDGQVGTQTKAALYGSTAQGAADNLYSPTCPENMTEGEQDGCVTTLQSLLNAHGISIAVDGQFGPNTFSAVESFQSAAGIGVDGQVGPQTKHALYSNVSGSSSYNGAPTPILLDSPQCPDVMTEGEDDGCVTELQSELNIAGSRLAVDGQFGPATFSAVEVFQSDHGLTVTGKVDQAAKDLLIKIGQGLANAGAAAAQAVLEYNVMSEAKALYNSSPPIPYSYGAGHASTPGKTYGECDASTGGGYLNGVCYGSSTYGLDCSGFTRYAYYLAAKEMNSSDDVDLGSQQSFGWDSATSGQMLDHIAEQISSIDLQPGDLIFFGNGSNGAWNSDHVVIYAGDVNGTQMVYAEPTTGRNLSYEALAPIASSFAWTDYYHMAVFA